jgi:hypothetical protein
MDQASFDAEVLPKFLEARKQISAVSKMLKDAHVIALVETDGLFEPALYAIQRMMRKLPKGQDLVLIIESHGGSIDTASAIASICRGRFNSFKVVVPFMAKSAATLLALAADERFFTCSTQLGPVDPQVRHPEKRGMYFPAHSIKEALEQVEASKDPLVKAAMADKLDPFLIGAYRDAIGAATQYIEEIVQEWSVSNPAEIISAFVDKYKSHGYPLGRKVLEKLKVPHTAADDDLEDAVCTMLENCLDALEVEDEGGGVIVLNDKAYSFSFGGFRTSGAFAPPAVLAPAAAPAPKAAAQDGASVQGVAS